MENEITRITLKKEDWHDIIVNNKLLLHIKHSEGNISIDMYKHPNRGYEEDFLDGTWYTPDDLK